MTHAATLAALRKGRTDSAGVLEYLRAITSTMHADDPICVALDQADRAIEDYEESMAAVREMAANDLDNERSRHQDRGEYDNQTVRVPAWAMSS